MEKQYFDEPKQVVFADPDNSGKWLVGIAYKDEIICACCGGIFDIGDVIDAAHEDGVKCAIYEYHDWINIAGDIFGGELPEGLEYNESDIVESESEDEEWYDEDEEVAECEAYYYKNLE